MGVAFRAVGSCPAAALLAIWLATAAAVPEQVSVVNATAQSGFATKGTPAVISARNPLSALQRVSEKPQKLQARTLAASTRERFAALQRGSAAQPAHLQGAFSRASQGGRHLTQKELAPITSIHCLQQMQRDPHKPCHPSDQSSFALEDLSIANYPTWRDSTCHSNQEFFCDPRKMLTPKEQFTVTERMRLFKERTLVSCGQLQAVLDPDVERRWFEKKKPVFQGRLGLEDYKEFNLAIALADDWPMTELDPKSMQYFGRVLMTQWGLMPIYNGVDNGNPVNEFHARWHHEQGFCPNTAVLFILPKYREAFLMSPSCEFICESRGGPEVVAATLAGLDHGIEAAILAGIEQFDRVLRVTLPLSIKKVSAEKRWNRGSNVMRTDAGFVWTIRVLYAFVLVMLVVGVGSFLWFVVRPQKERRRSPFQLMGAEGRRGLIDAYGFST